MFNTCLKALWSSKSMDDANILMEDMSERGVQPNEQYLYDQCVAYVNLSEQYMTGVQLSMRSVCCVVHQMLQDRDPSTMQSVAGL